jgi:hypothetical protein
MKTTRTMMPKFIAVAVLVLIGSLSMNNCGGGGGSSSETSSKHPTNYYAAFPANVDLTSTPTRTLSLLITGPEGVHGTVVCTGLSYSATFTTDSSGLATLVVPTTAMLDSLDAAEDKGIIVDADDAVSIVAVNDTTGSMGAYTIPPASALGTDYTIAAGGAALDAGGGMYLAVVATMDTTTVTTTPSTTLSSGHPAATPFSVVLNAGQSYQLQANTLTGDISGTRVQANHPIAVYGGHMLADVPTSGTGFAGFLAAPVPPRAVVGADYFTAPLATRSGYWIRLIGLQNGTGITYNPSVGGAPSSLDAGQVVQFRATAPLRITANNPLLLVQLAEGGSVDSATGADPCLSVMTSVGRYTDSYTFATPTDQVGSRYVNLVVATAHAGDLKLNGSIISAGSFTTIGSSGYSSTSLTVPSGVNRLTGSGTPFGALVYGWAPVDGYNGFCFTPGVGF